jgi:hypothetical protein
MAVENTIPALVDAIINHAEQNSKNMRLVSS